MQKKVWLSGAMAALGAAMLVAAAFAGPASSKSNQPSASGQKKGGTMNVNASGTDVDYIDPSLAYGTLSWQILDSVCTKLMYYPDKPDPVGAKLAPDGAVGFPSVSKDGKTYVFTVKSGIKSNTGETLTAANYAAAINRDLNPKMQSPSVPFMTGANGIVGAQAVADGKAASRQRRRRQGSEADHQADEAGRLAPVEAGDELLLPDPEGDADQRRRDQHVRVVRPVLRRQPPGRPAADHEDEPELQGLPPAQRQHVRLHDEHQPRPEPAAGEVGAGRLRRRRSSADGERRPRAAVRCPQGRPLPLLRERWSERRLHRAEHDAAGVLER